MVRYSNFTNFKIRKSLFVIRFSFCQQKGTILGTTNNEYEIIRFLKNAASRDSL